MAVPPYNILAKQNAFSIRNLPNSNEYIFYDEGINLEENTIHKIKIVELIDDGLIFKTKDGEIIPSYPQFGQYYFSVTSSESTPDSQYFIATVSLTDGPSEYSCPFSYETVPTDTIYYIPIMNLYRTELEVSSTGYRITGDSDTMDSISDRGLIVANDSNLWLVYERHSIGTVPGPNISR